MNKSPPKSPLVIPILTAVFQPHILDLDSIEHSPPLSLVSPVASRLLPQALPFHSTPTPHPSPHQIHYNHNKRPQLLRPSIISMSTSGVNNKDVHDKNMELIRSNCELHYFEILKTYGTAELTWDVYANRVNEWTCGKCQNIIPIKVSKLAGPGRKVIGLLRAMQHLHDAHQIAVEIRDIFPDGYINESAHTKVRRNKKTATVRKIN